MNLLIDMTNNKKAIVRKGGEDHRFIVINDVINHLVSVRDDIKVYVNPINQLARKAIKTSDKICIYNHKKHRSHIDMCVFFQPYRGRKKWSIFFRKRNVQVSAFDHGPLPESVFIDRNGIFGDSSEVDNIINSGKESFDRESLVAYLDDMVENNVSKRPQCNSGENLYETYGRYIFVPGQNPNDVSITSFAKCSLYQFLDKVVSYASDNDMNVVFKHHPHLVGKLKKRSHSIFNTVNQNFDNLYSSKDSVFNLIKYAQVTATLNSNGMVDNFVMRKPVVSSGRNVFYKSGATLYDEDVSNALDRFFNQDIYSNTYEDAQLYTMNWLKNRLLFVGDDVEDNYIKFVTILGIE